MGRGVGRICELFGGILKVVNKVIEIIRRKPLLFFVIPLAYLTLIAFLKWGIPPSTDAIYFAIGGVVGIFFLDIAEVFFNLTPSPFRTIVFVAGFAVISFFVISSTDSLLGKGLVLSLYLTLLLWQLGEWQVRGNLESWYRMVAGSVRVATQQWITFGFLVLFLVETYLFVL